MPEKRSNNRLNSSRGIVPSSAFSSSMSLAACTFKSVPGTTAGPMASVRKCEDLYSAVHLNASKRCFGG